MRRIQGTPCPVIAGQQFQFDDTTCDDFTTANLEYTTAFKASFKNVKPKRAAAPRRGGTDFVIHEDGHPDANPKPVHPARLLKPARRAQFQPRQSTLEAPSQQINASHQSMNLNHSSHPPRRSTALQGSTFQDKKEPEVQRLSTSRSPKLERPARRKTLFIPPDDTTQPAMWMGIFSPLKNDQPERKNEEDPTIELTGIAAQMFEKHHPKQPSQPSNKPRRVALQRNVTAQTSLVQQDRAGADTGKENVPPHLPSKPTRIVKPVIKKLETEELPKVDRDAERRKFLSQARLKQLAQPKEAEPSEAANVISTMYEVGDKEKKQENLASSKRVAWNSGPRVVEEMKRLPVKPTTAQNHRRSLPESRQDTTVPLATQRIIKPSLRHSTPFQQCAPISGHIEHPELYEDDWLTQQEIATKELLNDLLHQSQTPRNVPDETAIRSAVLNLYNRPQISLLYSRLQAALLYGTLSLSHEGMMHIQGLVHDIGRKREFLRFWIDTFDNDILRICLEVVTGKQVPHSRAKSTSSTTSTPQRRSGRKILVEFIEAFLLRHEDAYFKAPGTGSVTDLGTKTILKCLMLLKTLDMCRMNCLLGTERCLFQRSSLHKTSTAAVQSLMKMVNPSQPEVIRTLRQCDFEVCCEQKSSEEIDYHVENLAIDLRDGIILTRVIELLIFPPTPIRTANDNDTSAYVSQSENARYSECKMYPLTHDLRIPCTSRPVKLYNMQVAFEALSSIEGLKSILTGIAPEDIIDGHREKTIALMWALISQFGLTRLIDWADVLQEIARLSPDPERQALPSCEDLAATQLESERLLKAWVKAVASARGQVVQNFTTAFSDGSIFEAIIDEYEPYLYAAGDTKKPSLPKRLQRLGCSKHFADIFVFGNGQPHIFGKDFVLAALAFLCSRLVGPSKLCRKAIIIQRYWRSYQTKIKDQRLTVRRELAQACAASVLARSELPSSRTASNQVYAAAQEQMEADSDIWLDL